MFTIFLHHSGLRRSRAQSPKPSTFDAAHLRAMVEAIGGDPDDIAPEGARD